jgi:hypothetical protein
VTEEKNEAGEAESKLDGIELDDVQQRLLAGLAKGAGLSVAEFVRRVHVQHELGASLSLDALDEASERKRSAKQKRDREHEKHRAGKRHRVAPADPPQSVAVTRRTIVMVAALEELAREGRAAIETGNINEGLAAFVNDAFEAAFGDGESAEFGWAMALVPTLDALAPMADADRAPFLRLEPGELIRRLHGASWLTLIDPPSYVTRAVVGWAVRNHAPRGPGGGRLGPQGMAKALTHPEHLVELLDDGQACRDLAGWVKDHRSEQPFGWYWGKPPTR